MFIQTNQGIVNVNPTSRDVLSILQAVFMEGNREYPNDGTELVQSLSVNDQIYVEGETYMVLPFGFAKYIREEEDCSDLS